MAKVLAELLKNLDAATTAAEAAKDKVAESLTAQQQSADSHQEAVRLAQTAYHEAVSVVRAIQDDVKANINGAIGAPEPDGRTRGSV